MTPLRTRRPSRAAGLLLASLALLAAAGWQTSGSKISALAAAGALNPADLLVYVDVSDTTMGQTGTDKKLTIAQLFGSPANGNLVGWVNNLPAPISLTTTGTSGAATLANGVLNIPQYSGGGGGGSGTVTTVSVATANGLGGSVANPTTTPQLTLSTGVVGIAKGNGTGFVAASAGSDYLAPAGSGAALTGITSSQVGATQALAFQSVQTSSFNVAANGYYPVDATSASVVATLPAAPADGAEAEIKTVAIAGANTVALACAGSDHFNVASTGSTSLSANALMQSIHVRYRAATSVWYVMDSDNSSGGYAAGSNVTITTSGGVRTIAASGGGGGSPGGSSGQLQYNNAAAFGGTTNVGYDATNNTLLLTAMADPGTSAAGDAWLSSTTGGFTVARAAGMNVRHGGLIYAAFDGTPVTTNAATSIFAGATAAYGSRTIKGGTVHAGNRIAFNCWGPIQTGTGGNNTVTITVTFTSASSVVTTALTGITPNFLTSTMNTGTAYFTIGPEIFVRTVGASGTLYAAGNFGGGTTLSAGLGSSINLHLPSPWTAPTIDWTQDETIDVTLTFSGTLTGGSTTQANLGYCFMYMF